MSGMPVFVKIEEYKELLEALNTLTQKTEKAKGILARINQLKAEEDAELEMWQRELSEMERKVEHMNHTLIEPNI